MAARRGFAGERCSAAAAPNCICRPAPRFGPTDPGKVDALAGDRRSIRKPVNTPLKWDILVRPASRPATPQTG